MRHYKLAVAIALGALLLALLIHGPKPPPGILPGSVKSLTDSLVAPETPVITLAPVTVRETKIKSGSNLYDALRDAGVPKPEAHPLIESIKSFIDPRRLAAGTVVAAYFASTPAIAAVEEARPSTVELKLDDLRILRAAFVDGTGWQSEVHEAVVETEPVSYSGTVTSSLWSSATAAGMDPTLIYQLAEIFAWQVDFNREVQQGDRWRLTVERRLVDGQTIGYGNIKAAEYENVGVAFSAVLFDHDGSNGRYYAPDGGSLRRMFLRSPLKYGRITSGFTTQRYHPVLKINRAHKGVDYGAPTGTPVMAVGDGVVTFADRRGASGKMVAIRHNAVYETQYKHLSGFASGIASGTRVAMGQVIGYVGATGLATGPHLHYEFHEGGRYVDPQGVKFPTADPIPERLKSEFDGKAAEAMRTLPSWDGNLTGVVPGIKTAGKSAE